jgi:hypothetical protein
MAQHQYGMGDADAPAMDAAAVVPSDTTLLVKDGMSPRALYIGGAGTIRVQMRGESGTVDFAGATAGSVLRLAVQRVFATGTTATNIVALF